MAEKRTVNLPKYINNKKGKLILALAQINQMMDMNCYIQQ